MKVANVYSTQTGNTEKVAKTITEAAGSLGHQVDMIRTGDNDDSFELLDYDMIFAGSGVYSCMPSKSMNRFLAAAGKRGMKTGAIKPCSPRLPGKFAVVYCTYGGVHTGINEAVPCIKSIGQLFDHYGFEVLEEWYTVGAFMPKNMHDFNINGRLGDITGRPNREDLAEIYQKTIGVLNTASFSNEPSVTHS